MPRRRPAGAAYASAIDVRITPEPTETERAAILAALARRPADAGADEPPAWLRAALADSVAGLGEEYSTEPTL